MTFDKIFKSGSHLRTERIGLLTASRVMYEKHFHKDAMSRGLQRVNPIPTKRGPHCGKRQLNEPNTELWGNHFRLEIWSQVSCLISSLKTAFHRMRKLKESIVHPPVKSVKQKIQ